MKLFVTPPGSIRPVDKIKFPNPIELFLLETSLRTGNTLISINDLQNNSLFHKYNIYLIFFLIINKVNFQKKRIFRFSFPRV